MITTKTSHGTQFELNPQQVLIQSENLRNHAQYFTLRKIIKEFKISIGPFITRSRSDFSAQYQGSDTLRQPSRLHCSERILIVG
jgi:hypothetical protein